MATDGERGTNRRDFMTCMAWAGAGVVWTLSSGILSSRALADAANAKKTGVGAGASAKSGLHFVQISDTHIGFDKDANPDTVATTREAIAKINALSNEPAFLLIRQAGHILRPHFHAANGRGPHLTGLGVDLDEDLNRFGIRPGLHHRRSRLLLDGDDVLRSGIDDDALHHLPHHG